MIEGSTLGFNVIHGLPTFGGSACQRVRVTQPDKRRLSQEPPGLKLGHRLEHDFAIGALAVF